MLISRMQAAPSPFFPGANSAHRMGVAIQCYNAHAAETRPKTLRTNKTNT